MEVTASKEKSNRWFGLAVAHKNGGDLGAGSVTLRQQSAFRHAINQTAGNHPVHGINRPFRNGGGISEVSQSIFSLHPLWCNGTGC